jgi:hypothetical protein
MRSKLLLVLLVGFIVFAAGCSRRPGSQSPRPRSAEEFARDDEIFDAVLNDLVNREDFNPVARGPGARRTQIILGDETYGGAGQRLVDQSPLSLTPVARLQLRDDVVRRNPPRQPFFIAPYRPANGNIILRKLPSADLSFDLEFTERFPNARGYLRLCLPGFTQDGQTALLGFSLGPSEHGDAALYVLKRENGHWTVTQRYIFHGT